MGLGDPISSDPILKTPNFEYMTSLFMETRIAMEYLHITHAEFLKLPADERMKAILYEEMKTKAEQYFRKQSDLKRKQEAQNRNNTNRYRK